MVKRAHRDSPALTPGLLLATMFVWAVAEPAAGDLLLPAPEFQVNTYTTSSQAAYRPSVSRSPDGSFIVVWSSWQETDPSSDDALGVYGQRYDSTGAAAGTEFHVNTYTTDAQFGQAVAAAADGSFVVVWESYTGDLVDVVDVRGQRFDSAGAPVGTEFLVNSYTTNRQTAPAVAAAADGSFVVVWQSTPTDIVSLDVFGQRFDGNGLPVGTEFQVNSYATGPQFSARVAAADDGAFVVVWLGPTDLVSSGVIGQRFDGGGMPAGTEFVVNTNTAEGGRGNASVAMAADGGFVVAWGGVQDVGAPGDHGSVHARRFDGAGAPLGTEFQVHSYITFNQSSPQVAAGADGDFVVAWTSYLQDGSGQGVFAQRFDANGLRAGTEFQVNSYATGDQSVPAVASDGASNFVVAWKGEDDSDTGVFARLLVGEEEVSETVGGGATVTTDGEGAGATPADPVETSLTTPNAGAVTILEDVAGGAPPGGLQFLGQQVTISAPDATVNDPLVIVFSLDASIVPPGVDETEIEILRNGVEVGTCTGAAGVADPDPCVSSRVLQGGGDVELTILTSTASDWSFATVPVCPVTPSAGCLTAAKSSFQIQDKGGPKDKLKWKFTKGGELEQSDLGDPVSASTYLLCVYDAVDGVASLAMSLTIGPSDDWQEKAPKGLSYRDKTASRDGVDKIKLKTGAATKSKAQVAARGSNLPTPVAVGDDRYFYQGPSVTVQLVNSDGMCWTSEFTGSSKNDGARFKAKSP